jgi:hypothetical protein
MNLQRRFVFSLLFRHPVIQAYAARLRIKVKKRTKDIPYSGDAALCLCILVKAARNCSIAAINATHESE